MFLLGFVWNAVLLMRVQESFCFLSEHELNICQCLHLHPINETSVKLPSVHGCCGCIGSTARRKWQMGSTYILIGHLPVWSLSIWHHLPKHNAVTPSITGWCKLPVCDSLGGCPPDRDLSSLRYSKRNINLVSRHVSHLVNLSIDKLFEHCDYDVWHYNFSYANSILWMSPMIFDNLKILKRKHRFWKLFFKQCTKVWVCVSGTGWVVLLNYLERTIWIRWFTSHASEFHKLKALNPNGFCSLDLHMETLNLNLTKILVMCNFKERKESISIK